MHGMREKCEAKNVPLARARNSLSHKICFNVKICLCPEGERSRREGD